MADNVTADPGSGGAVFATDDITGVHYPINKLTFGALNSQTLAVAGNGVTTAGTMRVTLSSDSTGQVKLAAGTAEVGKLAAGVAEIGNVKNSGTFAVQVDGSALTALQLLDDVVATDGSAALTKGYQIAGTDGTNAQIVSTNTSGHVNIADGGGSLTIDGTVDLGATDNAVLDQIELNTSYGDNVGGGTETGALRVTLANNSTGVLSVDDNGGSLTVDSADLTTIAGAVSGTEMQVDVVGALPAGTNNIGDVDVASQPARAATTDNVGAAIQTNQIMSGTTSLTPKFAKIDAAGSGDNTVVAAVVGKKIRVLQVLLVASGTVNARFESGAAGTALTGQMNLVANTGFEMSFCPVGLFETASGALLNLELSAAVSVDGSLVYVEV